MRRASPNRAVVLLSAWHTTPPLLGDPYCAVAVLSGDELRGVSLGQVHGVPELVRVDHEDPSELSARTRGRQENGCNACAVLNSGGWGKVVVMP